MTSDHTEASAAAFDMGMGDNPAPRNFNFAASGLPDPSRLDE